MTYFVCLFIFLLWFELTNVLINPISCSFLEMMNDDGDGMSFLVMSQVTRQGPPFSVDTCLFEETGES